MFRTFTSTIQPSQSHAVVRADSWLVMSRLERLPVPYDVLVGDSEKKQYLCIQRKKDFEDSREICLSLYHPVDTDAHYVPHPDVFFDRQISFEFKQEKTDLAPAWKPFLAGLAVVSSFAKSVDLYRLVVCGEEGPESGTFHTADGWCMNLLRYTNHSFSHTDYNLSEIYLETGVPGSDIHHELVFHLGKSFYQHLHSSQSTIHNYTRPFGSSEHFVGTNPYFVVEPSTSCTLAPESSTTTREFLQFHISSPPSSDTDSTRIAFDGFVDYAPTSKTADAAIAFPKLPADRHCMWFFSKSSEDLVFMVARTDAVSRFKAKTKTLETKQTLNTYLLITAGRITNRGTRSHYAAGHVVLMCVKKLDAFPADFVFPWCRWRTFFTRDGGLYHHLMNSKTMNQKKMQLDAEGDLFSPPLDPVYSCALSMNCGTNIPPCISEYPGFTLLRYSQHIPCIDRRIGKSNRATRFDSSILKFIHPMLSGGYIVEDDGQSVFLSSPLSKTTNPSKQTEHDDLPCNFVRLQKHLPNYVGHALFIDRPYTQTFDKSDVDLLKMLCFDLIE